jgi:hypothetical protein
MKLITHVDEVTEASVAFGTGTSPQTAITIMDEKIDLNGNAIGEIEDLDVDKMMDANSAIAVEKEISADTLGTLFATTQMHFLPYVETSAMQLIDLLPHYYEGIRKSATDSLLEIVRTFYELSDHPQWTAGLQVSLFPSTLETTSNAPSVAPASPRHGKRPLSACHQGAFRHV